MFLSGITVLLHCTLSFLLLPVFAQSGPARGLIYSATGDYRHDSIPVARDALTTRGQSINVQFDATEDKTRFTDAGLALYDVLIFLMNTGEVLDATGKAALKRYFDLGGNFVAIHSASSCLRNTTFYGREVGAIFDYHPEIQNATVDVVNASHPSTSMLPTEWHVRDEMYNFESDPRSLGAVVVLAANESSYLDPGPRQFDQGTPHPIAWYQEHRAGSENGTSAGRSFYTSLGHLNETWQDKLFLAHVVGGISWALKSNTTRAFNTSGQIGNDPTATTTGPRSSASVTANKNSRATADMRLGTRTSAICVALALSLFAILL